MGSSAENFKLPTSMLFAFERDSASANKRTVSYKKEEGSNRVECIEGPPESDSQAQTLHGVLGRNFILNSARNLLLPEGYPESVSDDYLEFQVYDTVQALCSYLRGVFSTQAVLVGMGVGHTEASATAATLQWIVRDGTGMVGSLVFAWWRGREFDRNAKRWRITADILNDIGLVVEMIAPICPLLFLPALCASSLCRAMCGVAAGATRAALTQHFARRNNVSDVSAKDGSQEVLTTLVGMIVGGLMTSYLEGSPAVVGVLFFFLTIMHVYANYKALSALQLVTFNTERLHLAIQGFMHTGSVPSPREISKSESIFYWRDPRPVAVHPGMRLTCLGDYEEIHQILEEYKSERYILKVRDCKQGVNLLFRHDARPDDVIKGFLQCEYAIRHLQGSEKSSPKQARITSYDLTKNVFPRFVLNAKNQGWRMDISYVDSGRWQYTVIDADIAQYSEWTNRNEGKKDL